VPGAQVSVRILQPFEVLEMLKELGYVRNLSHTIEQRNRKLLEWKDGIVVEGNEVIEVKKGGDGYRGGVRQGWKCSEVNTSTYWSDFQFTFEQPMMKLDPTIMLEIQVCHDDGTTEAAKEFDRVIQAEVSKFESGVNAFINDASTASQLELGRTTSKLQCDLSKLQAGIPFDHLTRTLMNRPLCWVSEEEQRERDATLCRHAKEFIERKIRSSRIGKYVEHLGIDVKRTTGRVDQLVAQVSVSVTKVPTENGTIEFVGKTMRSVVLQEVASKCNTAAHEGLFQCVFGNFYGYNYVFPDHILRIIPEEFAPRALGVIRDKLRSYLPESLSSMKYHCSVETKMGPDGLGIEVGIELDWTTHVDDDESVDDQEIMPNDDKSVGRAGENDLEAGMKVLDSADESAEEEDNDDDSVPDPVDADGLVSPVACVPDPTALLDMSKSDTVMCVPLDKITSDDPVFVDKQDPLLPECMVSFFFR
jgi:hypothetical protein